MNITAVQKNLFIRWLKEYPTSKLIAIPTRAAPIDSGLRKCEVISAGPDVRTVKDGDIVLVGKWVAQWFKYQGDDCASIKEHDLMAVVE